MPCRDYAWGCPYEWALGGHPTVWLWAGSYVVKFVLISDHAPFPCYLHPQFGSGNNATSAGGALNAEGSTAAVVALRSSFTNNRATKGPWLAPNVFTWHVHC